MRVMLSLGLVCNGGFGEVALTFWSLTTWIGENVSRLTEGDDFFVMRIVIARRYSSVWLRITLYSLLLSTAALSSLRIQFYPNANSGPSAAICSPMSTKRSRVFLYASFDLPALLSRATQLRNVPCSCNPSTEPESGSLNWAIFIQFEDGV